MDDLENFICEYYNFTNETSPNPDLANLLDSCGEYMCDKFDSTRETSYLGKAVEIAQDAIEATPLYDELWPRRLRILALRVLVKFQHTQTLSDLEDAVCLLQGIINAIPPYLIFTIILGLLLTRRFTMTGDVADLDKAINMTRSAIDTMLPNHALRRMLTSILEQQLKQRHDLTMEMADIEEAICLGQYLINATPPNHPERTGRLSDLAENFCKRYSCTKDIADLNEAISLFQEADEATPLSEPPSAKLGYGRCLLIRYYCSRELSDLEEAIYILIGVVEICPRGESCWSEALARLAVGFSLRHACTFEVADTNAAVVILRECIVTLPIDHPKRGGLLDILALELHLTYSQTGVITYLDEAICVSKDARNTASLAYDSRLKKLIHLAYLLDQRHSLTGSLSNIDESILLMRQTIGVTPVDDPNQMNMLLTLAKALHNRYKSTGASRDLDEAIRIIKDSLDVNMNPRYHTRRFEQLHLLGVCLEERYHRTGAMSDLEESISLEREAINSAPTSCENLFELLSGLGMRLLERYYRTSVIEDLNEAISLLQESFETAHPVYQNNSTLGNILSYALSVRFHRSKNIADLMEAIAISREAISNCPKGNLLWASLLSCLGHRLYLKYQYAGMKSDLDEAIRMCQDAVNVIPPAHPERVSPLLNLGLCLASRFIHMKAIVDIMAAAMAATLDDPVTAQVKMLEAATNLTQHGLKIPTNSEDFLRAATDGFNPETDAEALLLSSLSDIENARQCYIDVLYLESTEVRRRCFAGHRALKLPAFIQYTKAYDVAKYTIDLIPFLTSRSLQLADKQSILSEVVGTSSIAAAIALHALPINQGPFAAIECLETGRGLIGGSLFQQYEVSNLMKLHPDLADTFLTVRDRLDMPAPQDFSPMINVAGVNIEDEGSERHKAEQQFAKLFETIRSKPGFQRFFLSASELDMLHAASEGPLVILNMCSYRCDALVIEHSGFRVVELPRLSQGLFTKGSIHKYSKDLESPETLAWLWDDIVCPVLDALGFTGLPADDSWPHVWWIPTGALTKFPLHAAGHHLRRSGETTLDRVISSYATSVKALIHSRRRGAPTVAEPFSLVAVAMEATEGHKPLIHAHREVDAIFNIFEPELVNCHRPQPYRGDVLSAMKSCQIFHFAGHGETHLTDPLSSKLLLKDWQNDPLTVASLLETDLNSSPPFLAYLSACGTGQILDEDYVDESIHLVNAFQLAGFRHVIGTLWKVDDELCVEIAEMMYKSLRGGIRDDVVSRGLHDAIRTLRDRWVDMADGGVESESRVVDGFREGRHAQLDDNEELGRPLWVPYVHFGV